MMRTEIADLVPADAGLRVIPVGGDLHYRARPMLIVPAEAADEFLFPAVAPQLKLVRLHRMHAKLGAFTRPHAFRPGVAIKRVREQPELVRLPRLRRHAHALASEARLGERDR